MLHHDFMEHFFGLRATFICLLSECCVFLVSQGDRHLVSHEDTPCISLSCSFSISPLLAPQLKRLRCWPVRPEHPQRAPQTIGTICLWARQRQPTPVDLVRFMRIDVHVAIAVFGVSCFYRHFLVPAMHAADGVRVYGEGQVLMHAALAPEDARRVGIGTLEGLYALQVAQTPGAVLLAP